MALNKDRHNVENEPRQEPATASRRQFFSVGARFLAIGGLASFTVMQAIKARRLAGDPNCVRLNTCADCFEFSAGCSKDKAQNFRSQQSSAPPAGKA